MNCDFQDKEGHFLFENKRDITALEARTKGRKQCILFCATMKPVVHWCPENTGQGKLIILVRAERPFTEDCGGFYNQHGLQSLHPK